LFFFPSPHPSTPLPFPSLARDLKPRAFKRPQFSFDPHREMGPPVLARAGMATRKSFFSQTFLLSSGKPDRRGPIVFSLYRGKDAPVFHVIGKSPPSFSFEFLAVLKVGGQWAWAEVRRKPRPRLARGVFLPPRAQPFVSSAKGSGIRFCLFPQRSDESIPPGPFQVPYSRCCFFFRSALFCLRDYLGPVSLLFFFPPTGRGVRSFLMRYGSPPPASALSIGSPRPIFAAPFVWASYPPPSLLPHGVVRPSSFSFSIPGNGSRYKSLFAAPSRISSVSSGIIARILFFFSSPPPSEGFLFPLGFQLSLPLFRAVQIRFSSLLALVWFYGFSPPWTAWILSCLPF